MVWGTCTVSKRVSMHFFGNVTPTAKGVTPTTANGWAAIDALTVAECSRSPCTPLGDVPRKQRNDWAAALADALELVLTAGDDGTLGLKLVLILSDLLLRKPLRGGRRAERGGVVARRFERWRGRDPAWLLAQRAADHTAERRRADAGSANDRERDVARALGLIGCCEPSRAAAILKRDGLVDPAEPRIVA